MPSLWQNLKATLNCKPQYRFQSPLAPPRTPEHGAFNWQPSRMYPSRLQKNLRKTTSGETPPTKPSPRRPLPSISTQPRPRVLFDKLFYRTLSDPRAHFRFEFIRDGIGRMREELTDKGLTKKRIAECTRIRIQTSANEAAFKSAAEMRFRILYNNECWQARKTWALFTKFLLFGARGARNRKRRKEDERQQSKN